MDAHPPETEPAERAQQKQLFRDLRERSAYAAKVARMLETKRQRRIERVIQMQRKRRLHQAR